MCGICGIVGDPNERIVDRMIKSLGHRGPDGQGRHTSGQTAVGITRLSIVDVEGGAQPIYNETGDKCIIFDGEIYNFRELRADLIAGGHTFRTNTDTEVILHLYEDLGERCVERLEGMFAFVVVDGNRLFLARDRFGIKPLVYSSLSDRNLFLFGSEVRAIFQHPEVPRETDRRSECELAALGFILAEDGTLWRSVRQVRPGCRVMVEVSPNGRLRVEKRRYYERPKAVIQEQVDEQELERAAREVGTALEETCRRMVLQDDLPKGIFLSGGLDSTLMTIFCAKHSPQRLHTFTIADNPEHEDLRYARLVAEELGTEHHEILISQAEFESEYPNFLEACESRPAEGTFDKGGEYAFFLLARYASRHVKVAFCGEGADELFGGYWMHRWPLGYFDKMQERLAQAETTFPDCVPELRDELATLFAEDRTTVEQRRQNAHDFFLGSALTNHHLWAVDRGSMWHGLEVRVPYMQTALLCVPGLTGKASIRFVFSQNVAPRLALVARRAKMGLPKALQQALQDAVWPTQMINKSCFAGRS